MKQFLLSLAGILGITFMSLWIASVEPGRALKGEIRNGKGRPVGNALVLIHSTNEVKMAISDSQGQFEFKSLPDGIYGLDVTASGFQDNSLNTIAVPATEERPLIITMVNANYPYHCGHDLPSYEQVTEGQGAAISGNVVDSNVAIANVKVQLFRVDDSAVIAKQRTDKKGRFEFHNLAAGQYALRLNLNPYPEYKSEKFWIGPGIHTKLSAVMVPEGLMIACQ